jgi:hypothetical protein
MKPQVLYGLHFAEGVAEYREPGKEPLRILILEGAIKAMDPTFAGVPVYVDHVDNVDYEALHLNPPDGWVVESFFNPNDGKHWTKFIATTQKAADAIRNGWKLSNAYHITESGQGGQWHGVDYQKEVLQGVAEHMAIVQNPRYSESIILTPEQFKTYNSEKTAELARLSNSKDPITKEKGISPMLNLFRRAKVENAADLTGLCVTLKNGKDLSIEQLVERAEKIENMAGYAAEDHLVKVNQGEMSVGDLAKKYNELMESVKKNADDAAAKEKEEAEKKANEAKEGEEKKENGDDEKKENEEDDKEKEKKQNSLKGEDFFGKLMNASSTTNSSDEILESRSDMARRGADRY